MIQFVPRSEHSPSRWQKSTQLILYGEIIAAFSEIRTKHINTVRGQNVLSFSNAKPGGK